MHFTLQPWQFYLVIIGGWIHRQQQEVIEYLRTENQVLKEKFGPKRILLNDDQRRRLAVKGKVLGRKMLQEVGTLFTPDTILRWHRTLVEQKWDYNDRRKKGGRPRIRQVIVDLILRFASENPSWGYDRIQGALANVGNVLKQHGIEPAPGRKRTTTWKTFIKSRWDVLASIDFTTIDVWTKGGLVTYYLLFVMQVATQRVQLAACSPTLGDPLMRQIARNFTDPIDGFSKDKRYVLMDRDTNFSDAFRMIVKDGEVGPVRLAARSLNPNSYIERCHLSLKSECLDGMIFFGEPSLRNAVGQYLLHYHGERNHQSLNNSILTPGDEVGRPVEGEVQSRERLGALLRYYHRSAA